VLVMELAGLVQELGQYDEAYELCADFLRRHPNEVRVLILLSDLLMQTEGFEGARRFIHRAVQLAQPVHHQGIAMLLASISDEVFRNGNPAAAYAHIRRSIQFAPGELQSSLMMLLSRWTTRMSDYFPLLGSLELMNVEVDEAFQETEQRARRLSTLGCWEPCTILYTRMIEKDPENGTLWYNLGLFYLWDDRPEEAAEALHKAAGLLQNFDAAVETEALAALLDLELSDDQICTVETSRRIERPRELSTRLQANDRFQLVTSESQLHSTEMSEEQLRILADVPHSDDGGREELGTVIITANFDGAPDHHVVTVTVAESSLEEAWAIVQAAAGDCIDDDAERTEPTTATSVPSDYADFSQAVHFDSTMPNRKLRAAIDDRTAATVDAWIQKPQPLLNNLSPQQASEDSGLRIQTAAAVLVLYSIAQRMNHEIQIGTLRERLNIPVPATRTIAPDQSIESVPLLRYLDLSMPDLTDEQVLQLVNRVGLIRDVDLMERVVEELFRRPKVLEEYSPRRAYLMKALLARFRNRVEDMTEAFEGARSANLEDDSENFRSRLELDLKELTFRLDDPEDPGIPHLLRSMKEQYFQKVPEIADAIRQELTRSGCEQLLDELETPLIVTAGQESAPQTSGKLWLPGQD